MQVRTPEGELITSFVLDEEQPPFDFLRDKGADYFFIATLTIPGSTPTNEVHDAITGTEFMLLGKRLRVIGTESHMPGFLTSGARLGLMVKQVVNNYGGVDVHIL